MNKKLLSLPDVKKFPLTVNKDYIIIGVIGNGYVIKTDDDNEQILILQSRFE